MSYLNINSATELFCDVN